MKKTILLVLLLIISLCGNFSIVYAVDNNYQFVKSTIDDIETELESNNTNVITELYSYKTFLQSQTISPNNTKMINDTQEAIDYYNENYSNIEIVNFSEGDNTILYNIAIICALAFFGCKKYDLSYECLMKAWKNTDGLAVKELENKHIIFHSNYYNSIYSNISALTNGTFAYEGNTIEQDCALSLHAFTIAQTNGNYYITDVYNFDYIDQPNSLFALILNVFYYAEQSGVIKPYSIKIQVEQPHTNLYTSYNTNSHELHCNSCDISYYFSHNINMTVNSSNHIYTCNVCNYQYTTSHDLYYSYYSTIKHKVQCYDCSYVSYESHTLINMYLSNTLNNGILAQPKKGCSKCGYIIG